MDTEGYRDRLKFALWGDQWGIEKDTSGQSRKIEKKIDTTSVGGYTKG